MNVPSNPFRFRDARPEDHPAVATLNEGALPAVSAATPAHIARLAERAAYFRVIAAEEDLAGFLIAKTPEADYDSPNFRWFVNAFDSFVYVDRIVIAPAYRGQGLGERFYADLETFTRPRAPRI
ncbi:MAG: GNAT family N-acetyltransferase, partial [Gemmatimonadetes bacterium]|nr:GNAT family N-acetyltransferase [Gemmatimonadota bacterium]